MSSIHTKGPWLFRYTGALTVENFAGVKVATVSNSAGLTLGQEYDNGRLIAAAPDMLEALETCAEFFKLCKEKEGIDYAIAAEVEFALRKAVGNL